MSEYKHKIGITQGDTNGIGWEVIIKALAHPSMVELFTPVVYGAKHIAEHYMHTIEDIEPLQFFYCNSAAEARRGRINLVECGAKDTAVEAGRATEASAKQALDALEKASDDLVAGDLAAVVTAPINKESMQKVGFGFTGHTEYFASKAEGEPMMIMCSDILRVALQTVHIPVDKVAASLSAEKITASLVALRQTLKQDFGVVEPRIAVLSLNPHAGDGGLLGSEEEAIIRPAIQEAAQQSVLAFGPLAADGLFAGGGYKKYDAILAMYHDQGLTPFKALSPDGVNFTAGLNVVRTSPDHGTAFDIAGKDLADAQSMRSAIYEALDIVRRRNDYKFWSRNPLEHFEREKGRDVSMKDLQEAEEHKA
ncbi:MAG: 4-hydroxythreonine-4-phosphate dehydrogenase PdxA [Alistipes sp.]|nr:4-hydroxythreonine-4-phosphate dehydrogenase PdxA [Alistipes sp.]